MPPQVSTKGSAGKFRQPAHEGRAHFAQHARVRLRVEDALALERRFTRRAASARASRAHGRSPRRFDSRVEPRLARNAGRYLKASRKARGHDRVDRRLPVRDRVAAIGAPADRDRGRPGLPLEQFRRRRQARHRVEHRQLRHADAERAAEEPRPGAGRADDGARRDAAVLGDDRRRRVPPRSRCRARAVRVRMRAPAARGPARDRARGTRGFGTPVARRVQRAGPSPARTEQRREFRARARCACRARARVRRRATSPAPRAPSSSSAR